MIKDNLLRITNSISTICQKISRQPEEITLVGVTKYAHIQAIQEAIESGLTHIGENKVQEGQKKLMSLNSSVTKHLIGHLQTNKVKKAVEIFDMIESVDSLKLAEEINKCAQMSDKIVRILLQVNTSKEEQKFGLSEDQVEGLVEKIIDLKNIKIEGLMTMAPFVDDEKIIRPCFSGLRNLKEKLVNNYSNQGNFNMQYLSMGMSGDYQIAIEEGSNMVRIGRAIFNEN